MNTIVTPVAAVAAPSLTINLDAARTALVEGVKKTGDLISAYATGLNQAFDLIGANGKVTTKWFDLKGKLAQGIKAERAKFVEAFTARGFEKATIDVYWSRVKDAAGRVKVSNRVEGATDPEALNMDDLKRLINRIFKMEEEGVESDWSDEKAMLMDIYARMGGDTDKLG
jgi:hypothetical protein